MVNRMSFVDTRHGTLNSYQFSNGNTLPYAGVPFGMNYIVPQTDDQSTILFNPTFPVFQGFRLTHQPSPWMGDFCSIVMTPITGQPNGVSLDALRSSYHRETAVFKPNRVSLTSQQYQLNTTIVPTKRAGQIVIKQKNNQSLGLVLSSDQAMTVERGLSPHHLLVTIKQPIRDGASTLTFYIQYVFDAPVSLLSYQEGTWQSVDTATTGPVWVQIANEQNEATISFGTSFISVKQASYNLDQEVGHLTLNDLAEKSQAEWNELLGKIEVSDRNQQKVQAFNHYLYRLFLFPMTFYEESKEGEPIHWDMYNERVSPGVYFTNNGFWDTFRTVYPLFSLIIPERYQEMMSGYLHVYREAGHLPKWLSPDERGIMPGTLINGVIADAAVKGILTEDMMTEYLQAMIQDATIPAKDTKFGRAGVEDMLAYGYVTTKHRENVNQTVDNTYSDFVIMKVAQLLGKSEIAETYRQRAFQYQHLFDPKTGFLRGKDEMGSWREQFIPEDWGFDYTEGSAWQNAFGFYHDVAGYMELIGGREAFLAQLITLANEEPIFGIGNYGMEIHEMSELSVANMGQVGISNQPSFHLPYLYTYAGRPDYTQHVVKQLCTHLFSTDVDGFPGDEDNGSMSGWYVFSQLGFYPVTPGTGEYVLGIPQFDEVTIHLPNNKTFTIETINNYPQYSFVDQVILNQTDYQRLFITHEQLMQGGQMTVRLSLLPQTRTYSNDQLPYSLTTDTDIETKR